MNNPKVTALTTAINQMRELAASIPTLSKDLLAETDQRHFRDQFQADLGTSYQIALNQVELEISDAVKTLKGFADVHYYLDLEGRIGKGEWRALVKRDAHFRISIPAVTSLRQHSGVDLVTARRIVEAYSAGQFE